jgi:hypothetical protein
VRKKWEPIVISAALCAALILFGAIGFAASQSGGDDRALIGASAAVKQQPGTRAAGDVLTCLGVGQVETYVEQIGGEFRFAGRMASVNDGQLLLKGPQQYVKLGIAPDAQVDSGLEGGQIVRVVGNFNDAGDLQATEVRLACGGEQAASAVTAAPTPFPRIAEAVVTPTPEPTKAPAVNLTQRGEGSDAETADGDDQEDPDTQDKHDGHGKHEKHGKQNEDD